MLYVEYVPNSLKCRVEGKNLNVGHSCGKAPVSAVCHIRLGATVNESGAAVKYDCQREWWSDDQQPNTREILLVKYPRCVIFPTT